MIVSWERAAHLLFLICLFIFGLPKHITKVLTKIERFMFATICLVRVSKFHRVKSLQALFDFHSFPIFRSGNVVTVTRGCPMFAYFKMFSLMTVYGMQ